ncbi:LacI family DNA-binding transcriptional regulator [Pseudoneobacillus sp. C159]
MKKNITISDVARMANVHKSTVSRVLNNQPSVNPKTKEKIWKTINELGYSPNRSAQSLASGKTKIIGVIISDNHLSNLLIGPFFPAILKGITAAAEKAGFNILLIPSPNNNTDSYIEVIKKNTVDGFVIVGTPYHDDLNQILNEQNIPYVFIGKTKTSNDENSYYVAADNEAGGYMATNYLLNMGHRDLVVMVSEINDFILLHNQERISGIKHAFQAHNLPFQDNMIVKTPSGMDDSYYFIRNYLKTNKPTALLVLNEITTMSCINALLDDQYHIPKDIAIIAFGDPLFYSQIRPRLTTVSQDVEWLGKTALEMLLRRINMEEIYPTCIVNKPELIIREST